MPETVLLKFASHSNEFAVLEVRRHAGKLHHDQGVKLGWPEYEEGTEHLIYHLARRQAKNEVELPFYTIWKSTKAPAAKVACTLETSAGKATVQTEGSLPNASPPINEEAEEPKQEEREEEAEEAEEGEGE